MPETLFTFSGKNVMDGCTETLSDVEIKVNKRPAHAPGKRTPEGSLSRSRKSDYKDRSVHLDDYQSLMARSEERYSGVMPR